MAMPFVLGAMAVATSLFPPKPHLIEVAVKANPSPEVIILSIVAAAVAAPISEEILFRGVLQNWLLRLLPPPYAIVATSVPFAALHYDAWPAPVPLFVLSLFLGYLGYRTSSLIAPIAMHCAFNLASMFGLLVQLVVMGSG